MVLEISTLERVNGLVKRRLDFCGSDGKILYLSNGESALNPEYCGVQVLDVFQLDPDKLPAGTAYRIDETWIPRGENPFVSRNQAELILGYDSFSVADEWDIPAMIEASRDGFRGANAYHLGETMNSVSLGEGRGVHAIIPVTYFRISEDQFLRDGINTVDPRFEDLRHEVMQELESAVF